MTLSKFFKRWLWLPYAIFAIGSLLTILCYFFLKNQYVINLSTMDYLGSMIILIIGFSLSSLIAMTVRITQLAKYRAKILNQMNKNLKQEIKERIQLEESKQRLEIALLQGQKLQSIGTLAGGIAHDFNNILYAVIGYVELVREDVAKDSLIYKNLGKVLDGALRGRDLIGRILAFSRRQHHDFEILNIKNTIEAALSLLRPTIPASVIIHFDPKKRVNQLNILGNQTQIHQVLVNIINNSVDSMDGEGNIRLTLEELLANDPYLKRFPNIKSQNYCRIEISDTGHGMDQQTMERIYEPFFTTKEVGKGTGLGMSIVHTIVKEHEGEITLRSRLGHGTTFTILLPKYQT